MKQNMSTTDKIIRLILAALFIYLYFSETITGIIGVLLLIMAGYLILTSFIGYCLTYTLVGLNTRKKQE